MPYIQPDGRVNVVDHTQPSTPISWSELADLVGVELRWDPPKDGTSFLHQRQADELENLAVLYNRRVGAGGVFDGEMKAETNPSDLSVQEIAIKVAERPKKFFEVGELYLVPWEGRTVLFAVSKVDKKGIATLVAHLTSFWVSVTSRASIPHEDWRLITQNEAVIALGHYEGTMLSQFVGDLRKMMSSTLPDQQFEIWLATKSPLLDGRRPVDLLALGDFDTVEGYARRYLDGDPI